ncbi:MAG: pyruvate ferredoxin oxidoreductase [bacterium]|nr:pyruvate ferredoxin oxidoreductase [bacterium]
MTHNNNKIKAMTGGSAAAEFLRQINPDVMAVYPITPQTPIIETFAKMKAEGEVSTEMIQVESEHSAMSATIGASAAGARAVTATSSQGLAYMNEMLYIASGLRFPIFMYVSARALSAPLNIHGDHSDVMGARDTGWIQIFSENSQEAYDNGFIAMKLAERVNLPAMAIMDGFHTSHTVERITIFDDKNAKKFIGEYKPEKSLLDFDNPASFGFLALQNSYFEFKIEQQESFKEAVSEYKKICSEFASVFGKKYDYFEKYKMEGADCAIVCAGSISGTAKDVVDKLREEGKKVGLLKIKLFRPFPYEHIANALKNLKGAAVLDRAMSHGAYPPIYSDIVNSLFAGNITMPVQSYVYGLGGREVFEKDIEKVFDELLKWKFSKEIKYIK